MSGQRLLQAAYRFLAVLFQVLADAARLGLRMAVWGADLLVRIGQDWQLWLDRSINLVRRLGDLFSGSAALVRRYRRRMLGWSLLTLGVMGLILPVIPGVLFLVIGSEILGIRHPWIERMSRSMYAAGDAIPLERVPSRLRPVLARLRQKQQNESSESSQDHGASQDQA